MEHIAAILTAINENKFALVLIVIILGVLVYLLKTKQLSYNKGKGLQIGDIISPFSRIKQLQWDFLQAETEIALRNLPIEYLEEPKKWRTHYVVGKYRDVLQLAIINNNITADEEYIESKQVLAYSAVLKATHDDYFKTDNFRDMLYKLTEKIIKQFVKIKERYEEE